MTDKIFIYEFLQSENCRSNNNDDDDWNYGRREQKLSNILCSEYQLNTTKDLKKNCFFTDVDKIIKRIDFFVNNKPWYESRGIPYQLGFLFYGPPGSGKTSAILAIATQLYGPVKFSERVIELNSLSIEERVLLNKLSLNKIPYNYNKSIHQSFILSL